MDGVAFTGSAEVGRWIARTLQEGPYARPALTEMGGKNPAIVTAAADLDKAAEGVARAAFGLSGQKCSACSRAIVVDSVHDEFVERLAAQAAELAVGDPAERDMFLGPVVNEASVARFEAPSTAARRDGSVAAGGERPDRPGHFVEPTVVSGLPAGHALERDELFLPFVTVSRVGSLDEAIAEANAPVYGLTAGIFTEDEAEKERFLDAIEAGVVYVNRRAGATTGAWPGTQTFCGWKSSGSTGKGGLGPVLPAAVHARAEPHDRRVSSAASSAERLHVAVHRGLVVGHRQVPLLLAAGGHEEAAVHQPEPDQLGELGVVAALEGR